MSVTKAKAKAKMHTPRATKNVHYSNRLNTVVAWCPTCKEYMPAAQVAWDKMLRTSTGRITATYAAIPHEVTA